MSHSTGGFNHEIEYNYASLFKYLYFNYTVYICEILKFVVLISSEDLVTDISPPYNLHTELLFLKFKYYNIISLFFYLNVTSFLYLIMQ